jgi:hypothetical protein
MCGWWYEKMADLIYELLSQAVKNTNITINLSTKPQSKESKSEDNSAKAAEPVKEDAGASAATTPQGGGLVRADLIQLISDLESVSATLKKINKSLGHEYTDVFFMLQNFDKILTSIKMVVNAV